MFLKVLLQASHVVLSEKTPPNRGEDQLAERVSFRIDVRTYLLDALQTNKKDQIELVRPSGKSVLIKKRHPDSRM